MTGAASKSRLSAVIRKGQTWTAVRLSGVIDEHNGLRLLTESLERETLLVDLSGVRRINSVGVRDWVTWINELKAREVRAVFFDCPPGIMDQVNLVRNFVQGCTIQSFYAPYYCEVCDKEENHRLDTFELMSKTERRAPAFPCDRSDCGMALDDVEENYFAFMEDQRVPPDLSELALATKAARKALDAGGGGEALPAQGDAAPTPFSPAKRMGSFDQGPLAPSVVERLAGTKNDELRPGVDMFFIVTVMVMLGLLSFIVYLILGLE